MSIRRTCRSTIWELAVAVTLVSTIDTAAAARSFRPDQVSDAHEHPAGARTSPTCGTPTSGEGLAAHLLTGADQRPWCSTGDGHESRHGASCDGSGRASGTRGTGVLRLDPCRQQYGRGPSPWRSAPTAPSSPPTAPTGSSACGPWIWTISSRSRTTASPTGFTNESAGSTSTWHAVRLIDAIGASGPRRRLPRICHSGAAGPPSSLRNVEVSHSAAQPQPGTKESQ